MFVVLGFVEFDRWRILPAFVLPLSVEFVAGGEGRPEPLELAPGLGGSGKSGMLLDWPMKIAEAGRLELELRTGRCREIEVIEETTSESSASTAGEGRSSLAGTMSSRVVLYDCDDGGKWS
jgi:hypothetical protein